MSDHERVKELEGVIFQIEPNGTIYCRLCGGQLRPLPTKYVAGENGHLWHGRLCIPCLAEQVALPEAVTA